MIELICRIFGHRWKQIPKADPFNGISYRCRICKCDCMLFKKKHTLTSRELQELIKATEKERIANMSIIESNYGNQ